LMSESGPGNLLDHIPAEQLKETCILVGDPEILRAVLGDAMHGSARDTADWDKSVILQIAEFAQCGDPDSPAGILKKRIRSTSIEFPVALVEGGNLPILPSVQTTSSSEPDTSILVRQNGHDSGIRQALVRRKRCDSKFAKPIKTIKSSDPNVAFTILKKV